MNAPREVTVMVKILREYSDSQEFDLTFEKKNLEYIQYSTQAILITLTTFTFLGELFCL